ncbi:phosphopantetheine-binding protein [Streptomyces sp. NPDC102406]|uniref:phosphopantetheine-binding protein n=1 Tax=Streptomyces sp. NPDC102406 TaxID=3366171 RepID=UPI0038154710
MTSESRTTWQETLEGAAADVRATVVGELAAVLRVDTDRIDPHRSFQGFGLDSIRIAELVAAVNARYGTGVMAAALYDHPTPDALAHHVLAQLTAPAPRPVGPETGTGAESEVRATLRGQLADILRCDPRDIDPSVPFPQLGLDSLLAGEFVARVNATFGLSERPATLYEHRDLAAMAAYIAGAPTGAVPAAPRPVAAAAPTAPSALTADEVTALLDAVRADMLTVDEATALLASRPA